MALNDVDAAAYAFAEAVDELLPHALAAIDRLPLTDAQKSEVKAHVRRELEAKKAAVHARAGRTVN